MYTKISGSQSIYQATESAATPRSVITLTQSEPRFFSDLVDETIPAVFYKKVAAQPDAIAVSAFDGELTYAELARYAKNLAHELVALGVGPETLVLICLDKLRVGFLCFL